MLQGFGSPSSSNGVPVQPEHFQPSSVAQRVLQVEQPELEPASLVLVGEQAGVRHGFQLGVPLWELWRSSQRSCSATNSSQLWAFAKK